MKRRNNTLRKKSMKRRNNSLRKKSMKRRKKNMKYGGAPKKAQRYAKIEAPVIQRMDRGTESEESDESADDTSAMTRPYGAGPPPATTEDFRLVPTQAQVGPGGDTRIFKGSELGQDEEDVLRGVRCAGAKVNLSRLGYKLKALEDSGKDYGDAEFRAVLEEINAAKKEVLAAGCAADYADPAKPAAMQWVRRPSPPPSSPTADERCLSPANVEAGACAARVACGVGCGYGLTGAIDPGCAYPALHHAGACMVGSGHACLRCR